MRRPSRTKLALIGVILAAALAGCLQDAELPAAGTAPASGAPEDEGTWAPSAAGAPLPWNWSKCRGLIAIVPVPAENLRPFLPDGFEPAPFGVPFLPGPAASSVGIELFLCATADGANGSLSDVAYGSIYTAARPPAGAPWEGEGEVTFVKWDVLVPDEGRRAPLAAVGAPAYGGEVTLDDGSDVVRGTLTFESAGGFDISARIDGAPQEPPAFTFIEYTQTPHGMVGFIGTLQDVSRAEGAGTVTLHEGMWLEQVFGARTAPARVLSGSWSFGDGRIDYAPAP